MNFIGEALFFLGVFVFHTDYMPTLTRRQLKNVTNLAAPALPRQIVGISEFFSSFGGPIACAMIASAREAHDAAPIRTRRSAANEPR